MSYQKMQAALDTEQKGIRTLWKEAIYRHEDNFPMYGLHDFGSSITVKVERLDIRFFSKGEINYRLRDSKLIHESLDVALGGGGRTAWLLNGCAISSDGLVLDFLPRYSMRLSEDARQRLRQLDELELPDDDEGDRLWNAERDRLADEIYDKYTKRVYLTGNFQAWIVRGDVSGEIVDCNGERIVSITIENGKKEHKVAFDLKGRKAPCYTTYV